TAEYEQQPISAYIYNGTKENSQYTGGEIDIIKSFDGRDMFESGIKLQKGETLVVNMGQNLTAVPNISFSAERGTKATLRFAEMLNDGSSVGDGATQADGPKGSIYQKSLRNARSQATYIFAGNGIETYQPTMSFFGYQYVEITATDDIEIFGLVSKGISSVSEQTGNIETNNENVNKLFSNILYGQLINYYTAPTDCNQRDERLSWTGDTQAFAQTAVYNFNSYAFLNDMQDFFAENAEIMGYVPAVTDDLGGFFSNWAAGWSDVLVILPWTLYLQTGDKSIIEENWEVMNKYLSYLEERERFPNLSWIPDNSRNFGDWLSFQGTSVEVIYDYYYGYINQLMAEMAGIIGKTDDKNRYNRKFEAIKRAFLLRHVSFIAGKLTIRSGCGNKNNQFMYDAGKGGTWENNSQTALLWMLKLGFYKNDRMKEAAERLLIENIKNKKTDSDSIRATDGENTLAVGFLGSNIIAPVLTDIGYGNVSYDLLLQDEQPSWLFEVKAGATTIWERWNSYTPGVGFGDSEMNSFNHYAYGSIAEWMYRYMAGIASDKNNPGFKNIILQPTLDTGVKYNSEERINHVKASYDSVYGEIKTEWHSRDGKLTSYKVKIPANTTATLYLPVDKIVADTFGTIPGVIICGMDIHNGQEVLKLALVSGEYGFTVTDNKLTVVYGETYVVNPDIKLSTTFPENETDCKCICHKCGLLTVIYNVIRFFWKLFKMNPVCECGVKHY
ncbi:MAG: family 78 glycoside hydrolase catalytic domain, partial [Clostridia bacterium]|nr:family 78 glycoside hydrolase catalytic domain [Clostridia bacterium]